MGNVPDLATVRDYLRVPATALSDADLQRMMDAAESDQAARCTWSSAPTGPASLMVAGMTVTATVTGGPPGVHYRASWGDGQNGDVTLDASGNGSAEHTYAQAGTFNAQVWDDRGGIVAEVGITVPGNGEALSSYPPALFQAFLRRVQREVAARNLPLGMVGLDASEYGPERLPFYDALVEEHERAFRRVVLA